MKGGKRAGLNLDAFIVMRGDTSKWAFTRASLGNVKTFLSRKSVRRHETENGCATTYANWVKSATLSIPTETNRKHFANGINLDGDIFPIKDYSRIHLEFVQNFMKCYAIER